METFGCNGVRCAGLDHEITVPHPIGGTLVLAPWMRRWMWEPDPAMTGEAVKAATWALLGTLCGTGSSTLFIQTFQAHTEGEGSGRISEGGAYG
jgi:hypothetical protein